MQLAVTLPDGRVLPPDAAESAPGLAVGRFAKSGKVERASQSGPLGQFGQLGQLGQFGQFGQLAQAVEPTVLLDRSGELTDDDEVLTSDNSRFDVYLVEGLDNQTLSVSIESRTFDPFLMVLDSDGNTIAQNDDVSPTNTNAATDVILPQTGTYPIVVNGIDSTSRGSYRIVVSTIAGAPTAPNITRFTCDGASRCTVFEGASDYLSFSYNDPNGNASEWTLNDFSAEIYPASRSGTIAPGIDCTCPTGAGDCNTPATDTYTISVKDTSGRTSNRRSVTVTCSP